MNIEIIKPLEGQTNWGNAINTNFQKLMTQFKSVSTELQGLRRTVESLDSLQIQSNYFIYITGSSSANIIPFEEDGEDYWTNPSEKGKPFDPDSSEYIGYLGWFVQTPGNNTIKYKGYDWNTGDVLIIYRQAAGALTQNIQQWKNIMGGYFQPVTHTISTSTGKITTTYVKTNSLSTTSETELLSPVVYWKPINYLTNKGALKFQGHYVDAQNSEIPIDKTVEIPISYTTPGGGNYFDLQPAVSSYTISDVFSTTGSGFDRVGIDVHFYNADHDILYFPYSLIKGTDKSLTIQVSRGSYTGIIYVRLNIFK